MLTLAEIINRILSSRRELTHGTIYKMIKEKKQASDGLLTDEGAAYIVASELAVRIQEGELKTKVMIKDLINGTNDVTITGRALSISPIKTFSRSDGTDGKLVKMIVADKTGVIGVALWDKNANTLAQKRISENQIVRIYHGYVREGLGNALELNVGSRGTISVSPFDIDPDNFPTTKDFFRKISELEGNEKYVNVIGAVSQIFPESRFEKGENRRGRLRRVEIVDDSGRIRLVLWNEKVDSVNSVKRGDWVQVIGAQARKGLYEEKELHAGTNCQVNILSEAQFEIEEPLLILTKISELKSNISNINVLARVVQVGQLRKFNLQSGENGQIKDLTLMDETGLIRLAVWNDQVDSLEHVSKNDVILIEGAYTRESIQGINLNIGKNGAIIKNPKMPGVKELQTLKEKTVQITPINRLKLGLSNITVEGSIIEPVEIKEVTTKKGEKLNVVFTKIRDSTGEIRVTLWRALANEVQNLNDKTWLRVINAYVKTSFNGGLEISSNSSSRIELLSKPIKESNRQLNLRL